MSMSFDQQFDSLQALIKSKGIHVPPTRKMSTYEVHDIHFNHNGVNIYVCVNYTTKTMIWRNQDTKETFTR